MTVMIDDRQSLYNTDEIKKLIETVVSTVLRLENIDKECQVSVTLVDNDQIKHINRKYRNIDAPTDVLSFPLLEDKDNMIENIDMDTGEIVLGDIVISLDKADEQSKEYGHSFEREIAYLTVHGMLHLLGYDHEDDMDRKRMREREETVLFKLNISR